jgi:transposase
VKVRVGIDIACRAAHQAACAEETGKIVWSGYRFHTRAWELEALWARLPGDATEVMIVMEPTRNAWVPLAAWFRRRDATVVLVPLRAVRRSPCLGRQARQDRPAGCRTAGSPAAAAP